MIKFSVITVCLNAGQDLIDTVENTLNQNYDNFEILVKDGFSKDGSIEKLPQDERIKLIQKKDNGIYDAMNQAIEIATGDYMIFMNAGDSFYKSSTLSEIKENIDKYDSDFYYGHCYNKRFGFIGSVPPVLTDYFCYRSMVCHQSTVYSSAMLKERGYNTSYRVSADRERMVYAVVEEKLKCTYIPVTISTFQSGGFCTTENAKVLIRDEDKKIKQQYFTKKERIKYGFMYGITLPTLRKQFVNIPYLYKIYKKVVWLVYRTRSK